MVALTDHGFLIRERPDTKMHAMPRNRVALR